MILLLQQCFKSNPLPSTAYMTSEYDWHRAPTELVQHSAHRASLYRRNVAIYSIVVIIFSIGWGFIARLSQFGGRFCLQNLSKCLCGGTSGGGRLGVGETAPCAYKPRNTCRTLLLFLYIFMAFSCVQSEADNEKNYTATPTYTELVTDLYKLWSDFADV